MGRNEYGIISGHLHIFRFFEALNGAFKPGGGGGGALPLSKVVGTCRWTGYDFPVSNIGTGYLNTTQKVSSPQNNSL